MLELKIALTDEKMLQLGDFMLAITTEFPNAVLHQVEEILALCAPGQPDLQDLLTRLSRLISNAKNAQMVGNAVAAVVGQALPVRIGGGMVQ